MRPAATLSPAVQAVCDRFVLEVAYVRFLAEILPERSLERIVPATGWTVRQTFRHIERAMDEYGDIFPRVLAGEPGHGEDFDRDTENAAQANATGITPLPEILGGLGRARDRFLSMLEANAEALEVAQSDDGYPVIEIAAHWAQHSAVHCLEMIEALPELRTDPLVLTWLLECNLGQDEEIQQRRRRLRSDALAAYGMTEEVPHAP